jgi:signal transduction histidine kinase
LAERVEVGTLARNVVELVRAHPDSEGCRLRLEVPEGVELAVPGDEDLVHRAVLNLVLNAAQWAGPGGRVEVALDRLRSDLLAPALGPLDAVRIRVSDSGPGVPPDALDHIFDPFVTHRPGGTGLGLALVQRAAESHGGTVFVQNQHGAEGWGATFSLYLPASRPAEPASAVEEAPLESTLTLAPL